MSKLTCGATVVLILGAAMSAAPVLVWGGAGTPPEWFFGLAHQRLGGAILIHGDDDSLKITNIGSSGQDGVSIKLSMPSPPGEVSPYWTGKVDFGPAGGLPDGAKFVVQARDQFGNPRTSLRIAETGRGLGQASISYDQDLCPSCPITVELLLHGEVVRSAEFAPPYPASLATGNIGSSGNDGVSITLVREKEFVNQFDVDICEDITRLASPTPIGLPDGLPPVEADAVKVKLNGLPPGTRYIGNLTVTGENVPVITISGEALVAHEAAHVVQQSSGVHMRGVGDVNGDGRPDVQIGNIGSSGQDGVSIKRFGIGDTAPLGAIAVEADWGPAGALPAGSSMTFAVKAHGTSGLNDFINLRVTETNGQGAVSYIPCDSPGCCEPCCPCAGVTVQAVLNGIVVDEVAHDALPPIVAIGNIGSSGQDGVSFYGGPRQTTSQDGSFGGRMVMGLRSGAPSQITLTGSALGPVTADGVRVVTNIDPATVGGVDEAALLAANVDSIVVTNVRTRLNELENTLQALGLLARAAGGANVSVGPDGTLVSRDCDDDGDGVELLLGEIGGAAINVDLGPAGGLPPGSHRKMIPVTQPDITGVALMVDEANGGQAALSIDQDQCPTCPLQVDLMHGGVVVASQAYPPPYPSSLVIGNIGSSGQDGVEIEWKKSGGGIKLLNTATIAMTLAPRGGGGGGGGGSGGGTFDAECVVISLNGLPPGEPVDGISAVSITGVPGVTVNSGELNAVPAGFTVRNGTAQIAGVKKRSETSDAPSASSYAIIVSNIGSSGQDGVAIHGDDDDCDGEADDADAMEASVAPISLPPGGSLVVHGHGTGGGFPASGPSFDATLSVSSGGALTDDIAADFSNLGSTSYAVQVYTAGVLGHSQGGLTGPPTAHVPAGSPMSKYGEIKALIAGTTSIASRVRWSKPVPITLSTGDEVIGDELRFIPENPASPVTGVRSTTITGTNLTGNQFVILDQEVVPIDLCPFDTDDSGSVDIDDLFNVINSWGPCPGCPADLDGNGVVDIDDLFDVINAWGACP